MKHIVLNHHILLLLLLLGDRLKENVVYKIQKLSDSIKRMLARLFTKG